MIGSDLNTEPNQSPTRYIIDFRDWPLTNHHGTAAAHCAEEFPELLRIVEERVKPQRLALPENNSTAKHRRKMWWQFSNRANELLDALAGKSRAIAISRTTAYLAFVFVPTDIVLSERLVVIADEDAALFGILQSSIHEVWAFRPGTMTQGTTRTYFVAEAFETFARPTESDDIRQLADNYHAFRLDLTTTNEIGLTTLYNRFHDADDSSADIQKLRELHVEMDQAVAAAYAWDDLSLGHGFHETKQGIRFTISEPARREVLQRLLKLNHERYAEEVKQGLHGKKGTGKNSAPRTKSPRPTAKPEPNLFADTHNEADDEDAADPVEPTESSTDTDKPSEQRENRLATAPIESIETDTVMAAFRQAARNRGGMERDELLKAVSEILGYRRLGGKIAETLRGHLRAAIRRGIIEADGATRVRAGTATMADYSREDLREMVRSVMRKDYWYEREDVIIALARYVGFARVTETSREAIKSAINSAIRQGILCYQGQLIGRTE